MEIINATSQKEFGLVSDAMQGNVSVKGKDDICDYNAFALQGSRSEF